MGAVLRQKLLLLVTTTMEVGLMMESVIVHGAIMEGVEAMEVMMVA